MPVDVVFCLQCGLAVSLGLAAQAYLDSDRVLSKWLLVSAAFAVALSGMSFTFASYNYSLALRVSGLLAVSTVAIMTGIAARLSKFSFLNTAMCVGTAIGIGCLVLLNWEVHPELAKFFVSVVVFSCVCYWRASAPVDFFLPDLFRAALWSMVLFPVLLMFSGVFFLLFAALADFLAFPPRSFVNIVVFYGIFHG